LDSGGHGAGEFDLAARGGELRRGGLGVDLEIEVIPRGLNAADESFGPFAADEGIGVLAGGQLDDANAEVQAEQGGEGALGGFAAGFVGIEAEDDFLGVTLEGAGLFLGEGGALRGDDVLDAGFEGGDEIDLAFEDDGALFCR
jgi:hypothetical protein